MPAVLFAGASVLALFCALASLRSSPRVFSLEAAGNPALSDDAAQKDLDSYFANAGMDPKAAVRKSGKEARNSLDAFITSLNSEASLGRRFCAKHPERCGKAASAAERAAAKSDATVAARNLAVAGAIQRGSRNKQKLLSHSRAPDLFTGKAHNGQVAPVTASTGRTRDARLGDDVIDMAATAAADDGDVHVDADDLGKFMFSKDKEHSVKLKSAEYLRRNVVAKLSVAGSRLPKLTAADDAELAKCNVPPPRPAYCGLLMDIGMDVNSVQTVMPTRNDTDCNEPFPCVSTLLVCDMCKTFVLQDLTVIDDRNCADRYSKHHGGYTLPLHALVPARMPHDDGSDLGVNVLSYGAPDSLVASEQQHEEGNLVRDSEDGPLGGQAEKGGPLSPLLRDGATRVDNPHWASEGFHYGTYKEKMPSLDRETSDQVVYGALDDYKTLGLALSDEYVSPDAEAKAREKSLGSHPKFFSERFRPLGNFSSIRQWHKAVNSDWEADDAAALEKAAGDEDDEFAGRSAVEQHLLYGEDFFNMGHPVDAATDNGGTVFGDLRVRGPGDGAPMPAFPRDTNAMERHPWTDQAHVFYDEYGPATGGIMGSHPYNTSLETV